jgi:hypothetical protein
MKLLKLIGIIALLLTVAGAEAYYIIRLEQNLKRIDMNFMVVKRVLDAQGAELAKIKQAFDSGYAIPADEGFNLQDPATQDTKQK